MKIIIDQPDIPYTATFESIPDANVSDMLEMFFAAMKAATYQFNVTDCLAVVDEKTGEVRFSSNDWMNFMNEEEGSKMEKDWIENVTGEMPVETGTLVDVMHRDGDIFFSVPAGTEEAEDWEIEGDHPGDIIAYRLSA